MAHVADEPQEPVVVDVLAEDLEHDRMVEAPETVSKVTLDEPARPGPGVGHLPQRGVAAPAGAKTVGAVGAVSYTHLDVYKRQVPHPDR